MKPRRSICAICGAEFKARISEGICGHCISKDRLREWDRLDSAIRKAVRERLPATLTLLQWLSVISDFHGLCAYCGEFSYTAIDLVEPGLGLIWSNVVPICRTCSYHKRHGFEAAQRRVKEYLAANGQRSEEDITLEYLYEDSEAEPYVPGPLPDALRHSPIFREMFQKQAEEQGDTSKKKQEKGE